MASFSYVCHSLRYSQTLYAFEMIKRIKYFMYYMLWVFFVLLHLYLQSAMKFHLCY